MILIDKVDRAPGVAGAVLSTMPEKMAVVPDFLSFARVKAGLKKLLGTSVSTPNRAPTIPPPQAAGASAGAGGNPAVQNAQPDSELMEWAGVSRYREANLKLPPPGRDEQRVVFLGDSITDLWTSVPRGGFFPGKPYVDRGIGGQTTPQMLVRFPQDVIALHPKVVVILAGTNDIAGNTGPMTAEETQANLAKMAQIAKANGIKVVLASLLPVSDYGHAGDGTPLVQTEARPPQQIRDMNQWLERYAAENGFVYLDYYSRMVDDHGMLKRELSGDGIHPNAQGYEIMSPLAEKAICAALKNDRPAP